MGDSYAPNKHSYYQAPYHNSYPPRRGYENGYSGSSGGNGAAPTYQPRPAPVQQANVQHQTAKSRRLYIGNIPFQAGLTDVALTQFFSAMYVAGFRPNQPGESLPVVSFWLHSDGKFGFMELRGEQEAVNMMQFNGVFLHGRPLRVNRPSDYKPELHNPAGMNIVPDSVNIQAIMHLCEQLGGVVAAPAQLAALAASQAAKGSLHQASPSVAVGMNAAPTPVLQPVANAALRSEAHSDRGAPAPTPFLKVSASDRRSQESTDEKERPAHEGRVISLKNLVTDDDLEGDEDYKDLLEEVETECSNYGRVRSLSIPRSGPWKRAAFVEYENVSSVPGAVQALNTKVFDDRQIEAAVVSGCETAAEAASRPKRA